MTKLRQLAFCLIVLCLPATLAADLAPATDCDAATRWVAERADALPTTFDELAALPPSHRKAVFSALPAEHQSRLWQQHLDRWSAAQGDLTPAQLNLIAEARRLTSAEHFELAPGADSLDSALHLFDMQALRHFTPEQTRAAFYDLAGFAATGIQIEDEDKLECDCAQGRPGTVQACPDNSSCKTGGCSNPGGRGCGLFHFVPCDGVCLGAVVIDLH
ncbi:MAG: bacteriocin fulvocin C-related protein [Acidobacteriota bacterium]